MVDGQLFTWYGFHLIIIQVFPDYRYSDSLAHELPAQLWNRAWATFFNGCHVTVKILKSRQKVLRYSHASSVTGSISLCTWDWEGLTYYGTRNRDHSAISASFQFALHSACVRVFQARNFSDSLTSKANLLPLDQYPDLSQKSSLFLSLFSRPGKPMRRLPACLCTNPLLCFHSVNK